MEQQQLRRELRLEARRAQLLLQGLPGQGQAVGVDRFQKAFLRHRTQLRFRLGDQRQRFVQGRHVGLGGQGRCVGLRHHAACVDSRAFHREVLRVRQHLGRLHAHEVAPAEDELGRIQARRQRLGGPKRELQHHVFRRRGVKRRRRHHLGGDVDEVVEVHASRHLRQPRGEQFLDVPLRHFHVDQGALHGVRLIERLVLGLGQAQRRLRRPRGRGAQQRAPHQANRGRIH